MRTQTIFAATALLPAGWAQNVSVRIGADGRITDVRSNTEPSADAHRVGHLLAAPTNVHSHAFQRAMAGLTEGRGANATDSFWTWRQVMYRFLEQLAPEDVEAITAFVQMEMLEAGYAGSVEFHYLHHGPDGHPYDDLAEMSGRICAAAAQSGIGLTLLPVLYQFGGIDQRPLGAGQVRFGNMPERFAKLLEGAEAALAHLPADARCGVAPHSLRAVSAEGLQMAVDLRPKAPIHMHIAEQIAEIEEIRRATGARPVEWLLDRHDLDRRWCLIHCTHMTDRETQRLAESKVTAGLCPITESSLGDGTFNGITFAMHSGRIGLGSDSNIRISLSEELRTLEYSQRLASNRRAVYAKPARTTGRILYESVLDGGSAAAARNSGAIAAGLLADLLSFDEGSVHLVNRKDDQVLDSFIFAGDDRMIRDVWSAGRHVVRDGAHVARPAIAQRYRETIARLATNV